MKSLKKVLSFTAASALLCTMMSVSVSALKESSSVHIVVENNTFAESDGAAWSGTLVDEWVSLNDGATAAEVFDSALTAHGYTQTGADINWITDINGLSAEADAAKMGGWMVGYNDWYGNGGISTLDLSDGDEITLSYSLDWGKDIGSDFYSTDTGLKTLTVGDEIIQLSEKITEYNITLPSGTDSIRVVPVAANKNYARKIYKNSYTPDTEGTDFKSSRDIPVADGDVIYIGVGHASWLSYPPEGLEETLYTLKLEIDDDKSGEEGRSDEDIPSEESKTEEGKKDESDGGTKQEDSSKTITEASIEEIINSTGAKLNKPEIFTEIGNEWAILSLARSGQLDDKSISQYADSLYRSIQEKKPSKATDYAKYIIILGAIGYNAEDFNGINLISALSDYDFAVKQGINGAAYTLIALDTHNYSIPDAPEGTVQTTRDALIDYILSAQLTDGGWAFFGENFEPDMTGIVMQALTPYYKDNGKVKAAVDKALKLLSENQNDDGTYTSYGSPNCENSAQIVTALSGLGIDADKDSRFVKEKGSALDGLKRFYIDGSFSHEIEGDENVLSTLQALYSACAYQRFIEGKTSLYDMSDVEFRKAETDSKPEEESSDEHKENNTAPESSSPSSDKKQGDNGTFPTGENSFLSVIIASILSASAIIVVLSRKKVK